MYAHTLLCVYNSVLYVETCRLIFKRHGYDHSDSSPEPTETSVGKYYHRNTVWL